jgi:hypothetical protein
MKSEGAVAKTRQPKSGEWVSRVWLGVVLLLALERGGEKFVENSLEMVVATVEICGNWDGEVRGR